MITFSSNLMNRVLGPPIDALLYENATKSGISNTRIPFNFDKGAIWLKFLCFCSLSWRSTSALQDHNGKMSSTATGIQNRDLMMPSFRCSFKTRTLLSYISFLCTYHEQLSKNYSVCITFGIPYIWVRLLVVDFRNILHKIKITKMDQYIFNQMSIG